MLCGCCCLVTWGVAGFSCRTRTANSFAASAIRRRAQTADATLAMPCSIKPWRYYPLYKASKRQYCHSSAPVLCHGHGVSEPVAVDPARMLPARG